MRKTPQFIIKSKQANIRKALIRGKVHSSNAEESKEHNEVSDSNSNLKAILVIHSSNGSQLVR
jgi:hypothetical protein